ncbi:CLUMA_CG002325, isoform A [Clunio marinus]|uniref:CLUMA_CG002325, isoform A n=1 Tax=Clunio marinus TaxID=568069 RepID=A0A1J1HQQ8_9DIPT|nr:CLUMA_CG002325, isoform A [Clunio marinus]
MKRHLVAIFHRKERAAHIFVFAFLPWARFCKNLKKNGHKKNGSQIGNFPEKKHFLDNLFSLSLHAQSGAFVSEAIIWWRSWVENLFGLLQLKL